MRGNGIWRNAERALTVFSILVCLFSTKAEPPRPTLRFLGKAYTLASYIQEGNFPMWEFTTGGESVKQWTTLVTLLDRSSPQSLQDPDEISRSLRSTYLSHGGQVFEAQTLTDVSGQAFPYFSAVLDDAEAHRSELNFVKVARGTNNKPYIAIYGVRLYDPDRAAKAQAFLQQQSGPIGKAWTKAQLPSFDALPKQAFER